LYHSPGVFQIEKKFYRQSLIEMETAETSARYLIWKINEKARKSLEKIYILCSN
jgi:hypothetical protein